jgi:hypothetical protein
MHARVAWSVVLLATVCAALDTAFTAAQYGGLLSEEVWATHGWPLVTLATLGCALMGALIVSRHPRHPVGWLLLVASLSSISLAAEGYSTWVLDGSGPGPLVAGHVAGWLSVLFGAPLAIVAVVLLYLIAPNGRLPSPRWRWVARAAVAGLAVYVGAVFTLSPTDFVIAAPVDGPVSIIYKGALLLIAATLVASAVSVVLRVRPATGELRRQLLWIAGSAGLLAGCFVFLLVMSSLNRYETAWFVSTPLFLSYVAMPACIAVAVLRHRLFDIDVIVNRALVALLATGAVGVGYVLVVTALAPAVRTSDRFWPSLLTTAVVALAFQPARRRVVRLADRLAYGAAAEPYDALADFSRRLGESADPSALLPAVAQAAGTAIGARRTVARLHLSEQVQSEAAWPAARVAGGGPALTLSIRDGADDLGSLSVEMPPGKGLRERDKALLRDLVDQAVVAFRNVRLASDLAVGVELLNEQTRDLVASRRRLISAGDAERSRLERAVAREVAPHLQALVSQLPAVAHTRQGATSGQIEPLLAYATAALEALRNVTRGVYPAQLARVGLDPALRHLVGATAGAVLEVGAVTRLDPRIEATGYFCVAEAIREIDSAHVTAGMFDQLVLVVSGREREPLSVENMRDRVEVVGGRIAVRHEGHDGHDVTVEITLPYAPARALGVPAQRSADSHIAVSRSGARSAFGM